MSAKAYPIWHPFTQMKTAGMPLRVVRGDGEFLYLDDGRKIIDCISSWWVTLHGHGNKEIADAIYQQAQTLEQVIFAGFTHEPAERLADGLLKRLPPGLTRVFFSDNGSTSVEVAIKMAYQYWLNKGISSRTRFIGFEGGYHGDTLGAMSAGGSSTFWRPFDQLMFEIDTVPFPETFENDEDVASREAASLSKLQRLLAAKKECYAAIIVEPLVQGAAGMRMCRPQFLQELKKLCAEHDVLLIFDEVMTGFGRTGDWFACTKANCVPDIICLSKGITGGFLPLSVTVATEAIFEAFWSDDLARALFHSHSYTANPIACAAANASLKLLDDNAALFQSMEKRHRQKAGQYLMDAELFEHHRFCGTIAAFDLKHAAADYYAAHVPQLRARLLAEGLLLRPLGNTIYFMPPLCTGDESLDIMYKCVANIQRKMPVSPG